MAHIVLTDEQMKVVSRATPPVEIRDAKNNLIGHLHFAVYFTPEEVEEARRRLASDSPRYTTEQVLAHLRSLESK